MTVHAFASAKGSPGVTTTVIALAAGWPAYRLPIIVEADGAGGDLLTRFATDTQTGGRLLREPSTVQFAAAVRAGLRHEDFGRFVQVLPGGGEARALVAPASTFAASAAISALATAGLAECLREHTSLDVLVDVGRLEATSAAYPLVRDIGHATVLLRPTLAQASHARDLIAGLQRDGVECTALLIGERPYAASEVETALGVIVRWVLPNDPAGARALAGDASRAGDPGRTQLFRAAASVATQLVAAAEPSAHVAASSQPAAARPVRARRRVARAAS
jgi:hypothetical protein